MGRIKGFYYIRRHPDSDKISIEVESKKNNVEITTTMESLRKDVYDSGLSACRCEELLEAVAKGACAGKFKRCR